MIDIANLKGDIKAFFVENVYYPQIHVSPSQYLELLEEAAKERRLISEVASGPGSRRIHGAEIIGWGYFVIDEMMKHGETVLS